ncbi:hypothetical protein LWF15_02205 [Kineosporia rhizophila]|uniref:hypothetical protein n=1 Tax=Kineosporia rhizophila TaxID=84633 RepID=UPI001E54E09C|nr:hypothetical protein [Kineosporia rhizophila]MCE0534312.1 hypothetical protein [Kineosporia rhizophila]
MEVVAVDEVVSSIEEIRHRIGHRYVSVAAPEALAERVSLQVTLAAGHLPEMELAGLYSPQAPLAILSALTFARSVTEEPALGHELARTLLGHSWSGAWTASVSRLGRPAPSMSQHLRSLLPGPGFLVRQGDHPHVFNQVVPEAFSRSSGDQVLLMEEEGVPGPVAEQLARLAGSVSVRPVRLPGRWESVYGTARAGQLAALPARPADLLARPSARCRACGLEQIAAICPFCRVHTESASGVGGSPSRSTSGGLR